MWHGYILIENLKLTAREWRNLLDMVEGLGPIANDQPAYAIHWWTSPDGSEAIFEANFDLDNLTLAAWKARIAAL